MMDRTAFAGSRDLHKGSIRAIAQNFSIYCGRRCTLSWTACKIHVSNEINGARPDRFEGQSSFYWYEKRPPLSLTSSAIFKSDTFKFLNWNPSYLPSKGLLLYFLSGANAFQSHLRRTQVECTYTIFPRQITPNRYSTKKNFKSLFNSD